MSNENKPWPLVSMSMIGEFEIDRAKYPEELLKAVMQQLFITTSRALEEAGRLRQVRHLMFILNDAPTPLPLYDAEMVYVPGMSTCPQCDYYQINNQYRSDSCPLDGSPVERLTWKRYSEILARRQNEVVKVNRTLHAATIEMARQMEHEEIPLPSGPATAEAPADGVDALTLLALTDLKESWYGTEIDKTKYRIVFEDETEESVYLKIVKLQPQTGEENS